MALVSKPFADIITFTRASTATYFDATGTLQSAAIDSPRFDYDPATLAAQGFLIEEARTNSIRNNTMQGAVAGTPGTLPTNWSRSASPTNGISSEIVGTGTESGITYIDIRFSGTCTGSFSFSIIFETSSGVAASPGQAWTASAYTKLQAGSLNGSTFQYVLNEYSSVPAFLRNTFSSVITPTTAGLATQRTSATVTTGASTAFVQPVIAPAFANGLTYDFTLRIGLPQLENNNISTGVASATVASGGSGYAVGDVLQIVGGTGTAARLTVATLSGSAVATVTVSTAGSYSVFPSPQPVSVTAITGTGTSATFNIVPQAQSGFATSVIPTTTTALTRDADLASVNTLSPWFNATEGTLFAEGEWIALVLSRQVAILNNSATPSSDLISIQTNPSTATTARANVIVGGSSQASMSIVSAFAVNTVFKAAHAYKQDDFAFTVNGATPATDTPGTLPTVNQMQLGAISTTPSNIYLRRVTYYPRKLSSAELQAITA